jgi:hypothetical protein
MKIALLMIAAGAMALTPAMAQRGGDNGSLAQGSTNGVGWGNGPTSTGQPNVECEDLIEEGEGAVPGGAFNGSSAFGGFAHSKYAGEQPQNSVNLATASQYDIACAKQDPN